MTLSDEAARPSDDRAAGLVPGDPYASDPRRPATSALKPWWRWLFIVPGLAAVGYGARGILLDPDRSPIVPWAKWFVGSALAHDLLVAPVWIGLTYLLTRVLPRPARAPLVIGLAVAGIVSLVTWPFVLGYGKDPRNGSFLPRDYGSNLFWVDVAILAAAVVWAAVATLRGRSAERGPGSGGSIEG